MEQIGYSFKFYNQADFGYSNAKKTQVGKSASVT
jgi:hypothetical protein